MTENAMPANPGQEIVKPSNAQVKQYILQVLDDYKEHDWDDALIAVDEAFDKIGEPTGSRQDEECLAELISEGLVVEGESDWIGMMTLRRVRPAQKSAHGRQRELFSV